MFKSIEKEKVSVNSQKFFCFYFIPIIKNQNKTEISIGVKKQEFSVLYRLYTT